MPRRSKIPPATRQQWLEEYERGKRIDVLAREAGRSERTVKDHLERAQQEREEREARAGLLRDAYLQHFNDLLGLVQELRQRAQQPHPDGLWPPPSRRAELLREALRSHTPRSELWKACQRWEEAVTELHRTMNDASQRITRRVKQQIAPKLVEVHLDAVAESLWAELQATARGSAPSEPLVFNRYPQASGLALGRGAYTLAEAIGDAARREKIEKEYLALAEEVASPDAEFVTALQEAQQGWEQARDGIDDEVELLLLRHAVPGTCHLCPGGRGARPKRRQLKGRRLL